MRFNHLDIELITSIPLGVMQHGDRIIWHYDTRGEYIVRSGYNLLLHNRINAEGTTSPLVLKWWKRLWTLKIPQKVSLFGGYFMRHCQRVLSFLREI